MKRKEIKELWELCGLEKVGIYWALAKSNRPGSVHYTDHSTRIPDLTLDNLFKYTVPKLVELGLRFNLNTGAQAYFIVRIYEKPYEASYVAESKNPAEALAQACLKALRSKDDDNKD